MSPATVLALAPRQDVGLTKIEHVESTLAKLEAASALLQEVRTIQDAKQIHDIVKAARTYAREQKLGREVVLKAYAVMCEAERKIGALLHETERARGGQPYQATGTKKGPVAATLAELGIDNKISSRAQHLFKLDPLVFARVRDKHTTLDRVRAEAKRAAELEALIASYKPADRAAIDLRVSTSAELLAACMPDVIITEPPRGREHLHLFSELARACVSVPLVAVRVAMPFMPEALAHLCKHLTYRGWTPKDSNNRLTLVFCQKEEVWDKFKARSRSAPRQSNGWAEYCVQHLAEPGDLVCDPFLQPKTALAALDHGHRFIGASLDADVVADVRRQIGAA